MSNRVVPAVYRTIMNDVIENVRTEFDEVGVEEAVLNELLRSWEAKVAMSRVADFSLDSSMGPIAANFPPAPPGQPQPAVLPLNGASRPSTPAVGSNTKLKAGGGEEGDDKAVKDEPKKEGGGGATGGDEDEINSDLDDPEDDLDDDDEEAGGEGGDLVIALYEKVQRVKNKWKVTLKDGLVSVNGKDYLFNKCSGEFEW